MKVEVLLSRLEKVRPTGRGTWVACCPAHEDRTPSMSVREVDDGRILLHCFADCSVESILGAVGLDFDALFPDKPIERARPLRRPFPAADVLECLAAESRIVSVCASDVLAGKSLSEIDRQRLVLARERIEDGRSMALG